MAKSTQVREELETLLNASIEVAADQLESEGEFDPFALALRKDGEIVQLEAELDEHAHEVDHEAVVASLRKMLREAHAEYTAVAVVADVTLEDDDDQPMTAAIQIALEHERDDPMTCWVPYSIGEKDVELAELVGEPGERFVFDTPPLTN